MTQLAVCPVCSAKADTAREIHVRASDRLMKCSGCASLFATPQPSDEQLQELYRSEYYSEQNTRVETDRKDEERVARVLHRTVLLDLLRRFPQLQPQEGQPAARVLDYGCGPGYFLAECKEAGFECAGVEFSALAASFAEKRFGLRVKTEPDRALTELPEGRFDVVTAWQVLEHTRNPQAVVSGLVRLLKPGGVFCVAVPSLACLQYRLQGANWFNIRNQTHLVFFSRKGLEQLLRSAGLVRLKRPVIWGGRAELGLAGRMAQYASRVLGLGSELRLYATKP